jgi:GTP-binding protein
MSVPQVVIVGRPNVGKSSVLNWLAGVRIAIVDDKPGVTRDRITHLVCHDDRFFELVDTGGMGISDMDNLPRHIEEQISLAIDSAAVIPFLVDARGHVAVGSRGRAAMVGGRADHLDPNKSDNDGTDSDATSFIVWVKVACA